MFFLSYVRTTTVKQGQYNKVTMTEFKDRALKKSFLTRAVNKAKRQMNDGEVDNIKVTLTDLTKLIGDFDLAHDAYVATLDNGADIASADNYYDEVCDKYNLVRKDCTEYVNNPKGVKVEKNNDQIMTVFRESVESVTSDGQKRLNQLFHHTTGEACRTVERCITLGGQAGYEQAMSRLKDRYGSHHVICEAVMSDLRSCSDANTPLELRHFADLLSGALIVLRQHGRYSDMDTQKFILTMCLKLQTSLRHKWREIAVDTLAKSGSYPLLGEFISFVETRATVYNDPIYGGDALMDPAHTPPIKPQKRTSSFATNTSYRPAPCVMCNGNHKLFMCRQFKYCSVLERVQYVTDNELCSCSVCLSPNHVTDVCRVDYRCPILDCNARHSKYIHVDSSDASVSSSSNFAVNISRDHYVMLPILPVTINNTFHTYALLDTGSSNSFCSRRLIDRLNINGPVTTYELNTIGKTVYQRSEMVNFKMSTISTSIDMKNIRVVNYIPTQSDACDLSEYSHLDGLRCPGNVTVDILIGQDYPYLLRPLEVRSGANSDPFAIRSILGWTISGPVISQPTSRRVISNSISTVTIKEKLERPCEADTFDNMPNLSPGDTRAIDQLDCNYTVEDSHFEISVPWKNTDEILPDTCSLGETPLNNLVKSIEKKNMQSDISVNGYIKSPQERTSYPEAVNIHHDMAMSNTDRNVVNSTPLMSLDPHVNKNCVHICRKLKSYQLPRQTKHPVVVSHSHIDRYIKAQIDRYIQMSLCKQNLQSWYTQFRNWCYGIINVVYISGMMSFWNWNSKVGVCYFH